MNTITEKPQEINFENTAKQIVVKTLSSEDKFYAIWIEKSNLVMEFSYSKKNDEINILDGILGQAIAKTNLSEKEKIARCSEALEHALWEHRHGNLAKSNKLR